MFVLELIWLAKHHFRWPLPMTTKPGGNKATLTLTGIDTRLGSRPYRATHER